MSDGTSCAMASDMSDDMDGYVEKDVENDDVGEESPPSPAEVEK